MKLKVALLVLLGGLVALVGSEARGACCGGRPVTPKKSRTTVVKTRPNQVSCRMCGATMGLNKDVMLCPSHYCSKHRLPRPGGTCARCAFEKDVRSGKATCEHCGRRAVALVEESAGKGTKRTASESAQDPVFIRVCAAHGCREHGLALEKDKLDEFFCPACQAEAKKEKMRQAKRAREAREAQRQARHSSSGCGL